jgi:hypothetical protein
MPIQYIAVCVHSGCTYGADVVGARGRTRWRFMSASNSRRTTATSLIVALGMSAASILATLSRGPA